MDAPEQSYGPRECGSCRWWRPVLEDERGPIGPCRYGVRLGDFPGTAPACEKHLARDEAIPAPAPAGGVQRRSPRPRAPLVVHRGSASPSESGRAAGSGPAPGTAHHPGLALSQLPEEVLDMTREEFVSAIREALAGDAPDVPLAPKWEGGTVVLRPQDPQLQPKEIPLDQLFHKVVMIRDRLRVLEQKINANAKFSDAEKVEMQAYLTKCYGSLTTFNVLFRDERDRFVGDKSP
jgi:hypothetical protein